MKHFIEIHWLQKDESILSKMSEDVMFLDINGSLTKDERVTIETSIRPNAAVYLYIHMSGEY